MSLITVLHVQVLSVFLVGDGFYSYLHAHTISYIHVCRSITHFSFYFKPFILTVVAELYDNNKYDILHGMFFPRIAFGTAGLRAAMAPGYHNINELVILQASQGLCAWVEEKVENAASRGIIIGYDGRHNSRAYADITAAVFLSRGFKVYFFSDMVCTPMVPYGLLQKSCAVGVMVTASHNPKDDNGYKVYWENGAQIIPPNDVGIAERILDNLKPWSDNYSFDTSDPNVEIADDLIEKYVEQAAEKLCFHKEENPTGSINVTYTAMHGVGAKFVEKTFEAFNLRPYIPTPEQVLPDPDFSTVKFPNPEEGKGALALAIAAAEANDSSLILANDPDADRLAVACKNEAGEWVMLTGNEIAAIFAEWTWLKWREANPEADPSQCVMIASTVSSKHLKAMAETEGFEFRDTLTGFKWIGNEAIAATNEGKTCLFAYEVEIGFLIGDLSFDKDGVRTAAAFAEAANYWARNGFSILDRVKAFYEKYGHFKMVNSYFFCDATEKLDAVFSAIRTGNDGSYPSTCGEFKIKSIRDVTTGIDTAQADEKLLLPTMSDSHMITFFFENGATATLRNSGTEPKLKYYVEVCSKESPELAQELLDKMTAAIIENFIHPETYGLIAKSG